MRKILFLAALITLAFSQKILACSCVANPPFLTVAPKTKTIALVKVRRYLTYDDHPHGNIYVTSMEVEIDEIYQGKEERKRITIWGTQGSNCLEYLANFRINEYYVVALFERGNSTDYNLSNCGEYWLSVDFRKEDASGDVAEGQKTIKLTDLKSKLNEIGKETAKVSLITSYGESLMSCSLFFNLAFGASKN